MLAPKAIRWCEVLSRGASSGQLARVISERQTKAGGGHPPYKLKRVLFQSEFKDFGGFRGFGGFGRRERVWRG